VASCGHDRLVFRGGIAEPGLPLQILSSLKGFGKIFQRSPGSPSRTNGALARGESGCIAEPGLPLQILSSLKGSGKIFQRSPNSPPTATGGHRGTPRRGWRAPLDLATSARLFPGIPFGILRTNRFARKTPKSGSPSNTR
jgi:hypothetical protein